MGGLELESSDMKDHAPLTLQLASVIVLFPHPWILWLPSLPNAKDSLYCFIKVIASFFIKTLFYELQIAQIRFC